MSLKNNNKKRRMKRWKKHTNKKKRTNRLNSHKNKKIKRKNRWSEP